MSNKKYESRSDSESDFQSLSFSFHSVTQQPNSGLDCLIVEVSRSCTIRNTYIPGWAPLNEWSARHRCGYLTHPQQTQQINIYSLRSIRNRDSRNLAAADLRRKLHGHRRRLLGLQLRNFSPGELVSRQFSYHKWGTSFTTERTVALVSEFRFWYSEDIR